MNVCMGRSGGFCFGSTGEAHNGELHGFVCTECYKESRVSKVS